MEENARVHESQISTTSGQDALNHAITAAELYMKAASAAKTAADRSRLQQKCNELISRAERLKKLSRAFDSVGKLERRLKLPRTARQIPTSERNILLRGSKLHGNVFPPWEFDPAPEELEGDLFTDNSDLSFSERQQAVFGGWKRPQELFSVLDGDDNEGSLMKGEGDSDLVQDITTDCSVVASLCASFKHLRPSPSSILPMLMFPIDCDTGQPRLSANGKYVFRMYFNGCFRKVIIDDSLPSSSDSRTLYVVDRQHPRLIWPALIEKAYLKVRGGYDFPGSNSGTDLWVLTGWIPQQLFIQSDDFDLHHTWSRIKKAYGYGDVVVTLGTGRLTAAEEDSLGLAGEHDYAVLDVTEGQEDRRMLVKNPWCDGLVWRGSSFSDNTIQSHPTKLKPGCFWITFDDIIQNFESIYLNWNPALFTERQDHHFVWDLPHPSMATSFAHNPQYRLTAHADGSVWILLSRHFQDQELIIAKGRTTTLADVSNRLGFMSLYIFDSHGHRVEVGDKAIYRGPFVDSPQTLAPFEAKRGVKYTIVVAQHGLPLPKYSFTLSFFSRCDLDVAPAEHPLKFYTDTQSSWTHRTAGGNAASPTYFTNPQYSIEIPPPGTPLSILLSTENQNLPVHIDLVWANGQRVTTLTVRDTVVSSGEYRRGCALASAPFVDPGVYTIVLSTFEPNQLAGFSMRVGSMVPVKTTPVPADAAGRLRTRLPPLMFMQDECKSRAAVTVPRLTRASVALTRHHPQPNKSVPGTPRSYPAVRLRVETGRGPEKDIVAATGHDDFKEVMGTGLRTEEFDLDPVVIRARGLWISVETMGSSWLGAGDEGLDVEVLSEGIVNVGEWESVE